MKFTVRMDNLNQFMTRLDKVVGKERLKVAGDAAVAYTAQQYYEELRAATPIYDQSKGGMGRSPLRDAWKLKATGSSTWEITNKSPKLPMVLFGTKPHHIQALHPAFALVFEWGGTTVYRESVEHPGAQPNKQLEAVVNRLKNHSSVSKNDLRNFIRAHL